MNIDDMSPRCCALVELLKQNGYPSYLINDVVTSYSDERDLFDMLRFLARHWQPRGE